MVVCLPCDRHSRMWRFLIHGLILLISTCLVAIDTGSASDKAWGIWHRVRSGDTVWGIADKYQVSVNSILRANQIQSARRLSVGKKLFIPRVMPSQQVDGTWYKIKKGDTLWAISRKYDVTVKSLMYVNKLRSATRLKVNTEVFIPNPDAVGFHTPMRIPLTVSSGYGYRRHPISRTRKFHHGVDLRAKLGTRVYAAKPGRIVRAGWCGGYGNVVVIEHGGGYTTWYGHLSTIWARVGKRVRRGQVIGLSGSSGHATGPHLHFEVRWKDKSVDASRYVQIP